MGSIEHHFGALDTIFRGFNYKDVVKGLKELRERGFIAGNKQSPNEMIYLTAEGREWLFN